MLHFCLILSYEKRLYLHLLLIEMSNIPSSLELYSHFGIVVELLSIFIDKIAADSPLFILLGFNHERYYKFFLLSLRITLIISDYVVAL